MTSRTSPQRESSEGLLGAIEQTVLAASIITMSVLIMGNVISRNIFGASWAFAEELGSLLLIVVTFGGLGYAVRHRRHISMSALYDLLPNRRRAALKRIISLVSAVVLLTMAYIALRYVWQIAESGDASNVLGIPMYAPISIIPIGFLIAAVAYLSILFSRRAEDDFSEPPSNSRSGASTETAKE